MEVEIVSKKENPLINRLELNFKVTHPKEITPKRKDVRDEIAALLKVQKDRIIIDHMNSEFGKPETIGYAKIYKSKDDALQIETKAVLKRNNLLEKEKKEEKAEGKKKEMVKKEEKPEGKKEEKKAEGKSEEAGEAKGKKEGA